MEIDWRGFELHPETPVGGMALARLIPPARLPAMREHLLRFAASFGVTGMIFSERLPNTRRALAMAEYAREAGQVTAFRVAAMEAYWRRGQDLESVDALQAIATEAGLDALAALAAGRAPAYLERVDAMREEAHGRNVTGIPTFFFGDFAVVGCQPYETLARIAAHAGWRRRGG